MAENRIRVHKHAAYLNPAKASTDEYIYFESFTPLPYDSIVQIIHKNFVKEQWSPKHITYVDKKDADKFISGTLVSRNDKLIQGSGYGRTEDTTYVFLNSQTSNQITWNFNTNGPPPDYYFKLELNPEYNVGGSVKRRTSKHLKSKHRKSKHRKRTHLKSKTTHLKSKTTHLKSKNKRGKRAGTRR